MSDECTRSMPLFRHYHRSRLSAFTLVELLVVISIIGVLVGLLLPAVQYCREASRRTACANNLHNQILALHEYHAARNRFPVGRKWTGPNETSWYLELLPYIEQNSLAQSYNVQLPWNDANGNLRVSHTGLPLLQCPSSLLEFPGDSDYGGVSGSSLTSASWDSAFQNGVFIEEKAGQLSRTSFASITDGSSQTIAIAESADRDEESGGLWISGQNCFSHDNGSVSADHNGEIFSRHGTGANIAFADGAIHFVTRSVDPFVLGALCTRNLGETVDPSAY